MENETFWSFSFVSSSKKVVAWRVAYLTWHITMSMLKQYILSTQSKLSIKAISLQNTHVPKPTHTTTHRDTVMTVDYSNMSFISALMNWKEKWQLVTNWEQSDYNRKYNDREINREGSFSWNSAVNYMLLSPLGAVDDSLPLYSQIKSI